MQISSVFPSRRAEVTWIFVECARVRRGKDNVCILFAHVLPCSDAASLSPWQLTLSVHNDDTLEQMRLSMRWETHHSGPQWTNTCRQQHLNRDLPGACGCVCVFFQTFISDDDDTQCVCASSESTIQERLGCRTARTTKRNQRK